LIAFVHELHPTPELGIVLSYEKYGNAQKFIKDYKVPAPWRVKMTYEIALGLSYMHTLPTPIIHRDLKLTNVVVGEGYVAKVTDCLLQSKLINCSIV